MEEKYKVLLVDDEPQILRGMKDGIDWESFGFQVVAVASNGQEAWEIIQNNRPDVLISDIRMPFMNGLELVEKIYRNYIKMKIILFSGFDDFEYAQKAIRYGVSDYLLKPVSMSQMEELLKRMYGEITAEIEEKNNKTYLLQMYQENLPILRERLLTEIIEGRIPAEKREKRLQELNIDFNWKDCVAVILQPNPEDEDAQLKMFSISKLMQEIFQGFQQHIVFRCYEYIILIVHLEEKGHLQEVLKCLNEAQIIGKRFMQVDFYCGVGKPVSGIEQLERSYKDALCALEYSVVSENDRVIYIQDIESPMEEGHYFEGQCGRDLELAIKMADEEKISEAVTRIFQELEHYKLNFEEYQTFILELSFSFVKIAHQYHLDGESFLNAKNLITSILSLHTGEQLKKWLYQNSVDIGYAINQKRIDNNGILAQRAKEYIDRNFRQPDLSVEMLCEYLHVSPSHFSNIFKKEHGINFITYLTNKRMEEAAMLLKTTDYKTKVISEMVGYPESNYFSYVFKKCMNVSPANFRKQER